VILCDHNLPSLDSIEALGVAAAAGVQTPFVILSGSIPDELAIEAMRRGARDFIRKDSIAKLVPVIERELTTRDLASELNRLSGDVQRLADFDHLTGLPNRDHLLRYLARRTAAARAGAAPFGLLLVDVNRFRQISGSLGSALGNQAIAEIARRIAAACSSTDFVARIGGDSFALVVGCGDSAPSVQTLAASLSAQVGQPMQIGSYELFITLSLGACCYSAEVDSAEALFANAETALCTAKASGGNGYRLFHSEMSGADKRQIVLEGALHRALRNREFVLHYQPQVDLASGRVVSVEALLRWQHPLWGLVSPMEFVPLLEETGLIVAVGEWIVAAACAQMGAWDDEGFAPVRVAVNLSALQFGDRRLTEVVAAALRQHACAPERLELEITESIVMQGKEEAIAALQDLRRLGVRIAVDDFGTGYSSLGYLKRFPITTLKIDQLFVRECEQSRRDQALVAAMIKMGHELDLEVVAEGVETRYQADFLVANRCELAQGYLFGKALPAREVVAHFERVAQTTPAIGDVCGVALAPALFTSDYNSGRVGNSFADGCR